MKKQWVSTMKLINPFQLNNWSIKRTFVIVLSCQLALWGVIGLNLINLRLPVIRALIVSINLLFIPGMLVLKGMRLNKLGTIETLLYSVGLSIAGIMFVGLFLNSLSLHFGILRPFSLVPLMIILTICIGMLLLLCYKTANNDYKLSYFNISYENINPLLFLCIIPFLAIFGANVVNSYQDNIIIMILIISIFIIILMVGFDVFIPKDLYPLAVFIVGISLLFHNSLISKYLVGWDIHFEYFLSNLVINQGYWNSSISSSVNATLSIVIFPTIFSILSDINLIWIYKIIYPLLFSLVPVGLYEIYRQQTNEKIAILSVFFFTSLFVFFTEMLSLARQQIAELFLILIILSLINDRIDKLRKSILQIIFTCSLIVSHYGLSYIFVASLIVAWIMLYIASHYKYHSILVRISKYYILICIVITISWYMFISSSVTFNTVVHIGEKILSNFYTDFLDPNTAQGAKLILTKNESFWHDFAKYIHLISQFFISLGILGLFIKRKGGIRTKFNYEYSAFSITYFFILVAGVTVPYFSNTLNTSRLYHISLIFLAPFFTIGGEMFFTNIFRYINRKWTAKYINYPLKSISLFVGIFLLLNSGFIYQIVGENSTSVSLNMNETGGSLMFNENEVTGSKWLSTARNGNLSYGDQSSWLLLSGTMGLDNVRKIDANTKSVPPHSYIFLRSWNLRGGKIEVREGISVNHYTFLKDSTFYKNVILQCNQVYNNNDISIFYEDF